MNQEAVKKEILEFIKFISVEDHDFISSTDLFEWGIIDSLNFIELILFLENRFGIDINFRNFRKNYFESIDKMTEYILKGDR